jgi:hypothetical protein
MKTRFSTLLLFILLVWLISGCYTGNVNQDTGNSYDSTNPEYNVDDLNQYGQWIDVYPYGRVWSPSVVNDWQPFTNGHWTYDRNDWVWVSYEPFGWMVYHYGSWEYSMDQGWFWIPGSDEWSPACVQWIDYGDFVGWAPRRVYNRNWSEPWENNNVHAWMLVRKVDFNKENIYTYRVPSISRLDNTIQIQRRQPDVKTIQRYVKDPIEVVKFDKEPVVTRSSQVNAKNDPEKSVNPPVIPREKTNTPPPVSQREIKTTKPHTIVHMQVPPAEMKKIDKYRPKVEKDVMKKKSSSPQKDK